MCLSIHRPPAKRTIIIAILSSNRVQVNSACFELIKRYNTAHANFNLDSFNQYYITEIYPNCQEIDF